MAGEPIHHHDDPELLSRLRAALESKDIEAYARLYAEDAILEEVSALTPPAHPQVTHGREAIQERLHKDLLEDPVSGWARRIEKSEIVDAIETPDGLAFTELRTYVAGDRVIAQHLARKEHGLITHDRMVIAWDGTT